MTDILNGINKLFGNFSFAMIDQNLLILFLTVLFFVGFSEMRLNDKLVITTTIIAGLGITGIFTGFLGIITMILLGTLVTLNEFKTGE